MPLKAVLFDFNGVIINDESLRQSIFAELMVEENLRPKADEYWQLCLGRGDRTAMAALFEPRGRIMTDEYYQTLSDRKTQRYLEELSEYPKLPIYPGLTDVLFQLRAAHIATAVVSGTPRAEVDYVLEQAKLRTQFNAIISGEDLIVGSPEPDGYLAAVEELNESLPTLRLTPSECLVVDDTPAGIEAAKAAGMSVVGVANTYPFHMMQRQANWAVDYLSELELDRVRQVFNGAELRPAAG
jgi:HAD superfamily hydrolase (TIGR01509 family)